MPVRLLCTFIGSGSSLLPRLLRPASIVPPLPSGGDLRVPGRHGPRPVPVPRSTSPSRSNPSDVTGIPLETASKSLSCVHVPIRESSRFAPYSRVAEPGVIHA